MRVDYFFSYIMDKKSEEYKKAYNQADKLYGTNSSIYRSAYIVKKYKELGGKFKGAPPTASKGLKRWIEREQWIHVIPYLSRGEIVPCGSSNKIEPCRPLKRANSGTPITIGELVELHGKKNLMAAAKQKLENPELRLAWKSLTLT